MARIKCPHCGVSNRDSQPLDTCWQCGKRLWEPVERPAHAPHTMPPLAPTTLLQPTETPSPTVSHRKMVIAALATALSLLLLVMALILYLNSGPTEENGGVNAPSELPVR